MKTFKTTLNVLLLAAMAFTGISNAVAVNENAKARVWIQYQPGTQQAVTQGLRGAGAQVHHKFDKLNAMAVSLPQQAVSALAKNPNIVSIEEDAKRYPSAQTLPYGIDAVQARDIWDVDRNGTVDMGAPNGAGRMVCVIDSGLYTAHEDFAGVNVVGGYPGNWNTDSCGHGTHVAGTIAAANNDVGVVGVTPGSTSLYIVKVFGGSDCAWTYSSDLVNAAQRCEDAGANIISMSLGGSTKSRSEDQAFAQLYDNGILSIAAAGNDGNTRKSYPASYDSVMSVAAVDSNNLVADFSQQNGAVEIAAPGVGVLSTLPWLTTATVTVNGASYSGTTIEFSAQGSASGTLVDGGLCDSVGSWNGAIVLCERGSISFFDKVNNVQNGGGSAAVLYNNVPGGFAGTLGDGNISTIPAIGISQEDGQLLVASDIGSTADVVSNVTQPASGYEAWDGTSMATPHVAGVAALIWSADSSKTNAQIREALTQTALDLGTAGLDNAYGYGLVQAFDAWQYLGGGAGSGNNPPAASFSYSCPDLSCSFDASASSDSDGSIVSYAWDFGDGATASGVNASHNYAAGGSYSVTLTVTDDAGAISNSTQTVSVGTGGADTTAPVISNVASAKTKGRSFEITWTTDESANSVVVFNCCGAFTDVAMVTSHTMSFDGSKNTSYEYFVRSTDAAGNTSEAGPFIHQN